MVFYENVAVLQHFALQLHQYTLIVALENVVLQCIQCCRFTNYIAISVCFIRDDKVIKNVDKFN